MQSAKPSAASRAAAIKTDRIHMLIEPARRAEWERCAAADGRTLSGWIAKACDELAMRQERERSKDALRGAR